MRAHLGAVAAASLGPSAVLAVVGLALYWTERVLAVSSLRAPFALAIAVLVAARGLAAARVARLVAAHAAVEPAPGDRRIAIATAAALSALMDAPALALAAWMGQLGVLGAALLLPVVGLRWMGASPTWLTRLALLDEGVGRAWLAGWRDLAGARGKAFVVETMLGVVALLLFVNGYALLLGAAAVGGSLLGLDVAFATAFLSPTNGFALAAVGLVSLLAVEPLRMVAGTLLWVDGRVRHDALDLRRRVESLGAKTVLPATAALAVLLLVAPAAAQPQEIAVAPLPAPAATESEPMRAAAREILAAPEFRPVPEPGEGRLGDEIRTWIREWLDRLLPDPSRFPKLGLDFALPGMWVFLLVGAVVVLATIAFVVWVLRTSRRPAAAEAEEAEAGVDPRERDPLDILAEAAELRRRGALRDALRTVFLATLVQLDRRHEIAFDTTRTNAQVLRDLPPGERREWLAALTRLFDHKWYGHEPVTDADVEAADREARRLLDEPPRRPPLEPRDGAPAR